MNRENIDFLNKLYNENLDVRNEDKEKLEIIYSDIKEIDIFLDNLLNEEDSDIHVFQPRKIENIFADLISEHNEKKEQLLEKAKELEKKITGQNIYLENMKNVLDDAESSNRNLRDVQNMVLDLQEKERNRISTILHDTILQTLTNNIHELELCHYYLKDSVKLQQELEIIEKNTRNIIDNLRSTMSHMRPMVIDDLDFNNALDKLIDKFCGKSSFIIKKDLDNLIFSDNEDNEILKLNIYCIIQECLINAVNHSQGTEIYIKMKKRENDLCIEISDNGIGFDISEKVSSSNHFGISIMKERIVLLNGKLHISNENGTKISIDIPLNIE